MADIFISYSSEDRDLVAKLARDLEAHGLTVWWDFNLVGGQGFREQIHEQLTAAYAVIVIWSRASVASKWVLDEADEAARMKKLIPLRMPDLQVHDIPLGHRQAQTYLVMERERIVAAIRALWGKPALTTKSPSQSEAEVALWEEVKAENTMDAYSFYLRCFPEGDHLHNADYEIWKQTIKQQSKEGYQNYLRLLPNGDYAAKADVAIWNIVSKSNTLSDYKFYLDSVTNGAFVANADEAIWGIASSNDDIMDYQFYLELCSERKASCGCIFSIYQASKNLGGKADATAKSRAAAKNWQNWLAGRGSFHRTRHQLSALDRAQNTRVADCFSLFTKRQLSCYRRQSGVHRSL